MFLAGFAAATVIAGATYLIEARPGTKAPLSAQAAPVPVAPVPPPPPAPRLHSEPILDTAFTVDSGKFSAYKFEVPPNVKNVKVTGHFAVTGGANNSLEVFMTNEDGMANMKNNNHYRRFYSSGKVTQDAIQIVLPPAPDAYYLLFDNRSAMLIPRAVQANATLTYLQ